MNDEANIPLGDVRAIAEALADVLKERGVFGLDSSRPVRVLTTTDVAEILGRDGVCVRAGHHCAQPLMRRLGVPASSRASFAVHSTREDVDRLIEGLDRVREVFA